jgi:hypothetical protein
MNKQIKLWQDMADLTMQKCRQKCRVLGSCCSLEYCQIADEYAKEKGITLEPTGNPIPFLTTEGVCTVPPHLRIFCTLHQCDIQSLGFDPKDPKWTRQYFNLREQLKDF